MGTAERGGNTRSPGDNARPIRLALADDHALFRAGLKSLLALQPTVTVVAETDRIDDVLPMLSRTPCDILLLDLSMDRNAVGEIPALSGRVAVAVLTASEAIGDALAALRAGARAVVFKRFALESLMDAIKAVEEGQTWMPASLQAHFAAVLREPPHALSAREREIVRYVALGLRNAEVGQKLFVSGATVKKHLHNIFHKTGLRDRVELVRYAIRHGIIGIHEAPCEQYPSHEHEVG